MHCFSWLSIFLDIHGSMLEGRLRCILNFNSFNSALARGRTRFDSGASLRRIASNPVPAWPAKDGISSQCPIAPGDVTIFRIVFVSNPVD
jgi:hypothetical protein